MAAGVVVVSSNVSGAAHDLIEDGKSGRIFPAGNLNELKEAILQVTAAHALAQYKEQSHASLAQWLAATDPVAEIRRALRDAGVLSANLVGHTPEVEFACHELTPKMQVAAS